MKRRELLTAGLALGCAYIPSLVFAQSRLAGRPFRIAFSYRFASAEVRALHVALMTKHGWQASRDYEFVESDENWPDFTKADQTIGRLLAGKPDIVVVGSTAHAVAAHRLTKSIPIVMVVSGYPVEAGLADSLSRPGRNVTGNALYASTGIWGKLLELLKETRPGVKRIGVLWTYVPPAFVKQEIEQCLVELRRDAATLGVSVSIIDAATDAALPAAIEKLAATKPDALVTTSGAGAWRNWQRLMVFAIERRMPTIVDFFRVPGAMAGPEPLLRYAPNPAELRERCYVYVDKILRGAQPQDLPILLPSTFELTVNLATAKAIGLQVPPQLLARAAQVVE